MKYRGILNSVFMALILGCLYSGVLAQSSGGIQIKRIVNLNYDCKNPRLFTEAVNSFEMASIVVFEVHKPSGVGLYYTMYNSQTDSFSNPQPIVDDGFINKNPTVQQYQENGKNRAAVYWQTNKNGNWDIACCVRDSGAWGAPVTLAGTPADETSPLISAHGLFNYKYNLTYKQNKSIRFVTLKNGAPDDSQIFEGNDSTDYSDATSMFTNPQDILFVAKKTTPSGGSRWVYKALTTSLGAEFTIPDQLQINSAKFVARYPGVSFNPGLLLGVTKQDKKQIYYVDRNHLGDPSALLRLPFDTTISVFNYSFYSDPVFVSNQVSGEGMLTFEPSCVNFMNGNELFLEVIGSLGLSANKKDTSLKITYTNSGNTVAKMGVVNMYIVSYTIWEDIADGHVQLFGMRRFDNADGIQPAANKKDFAVFYNYPNPFNPSTTLSFTVDGNPRVRVAVYDVLGNEVAVLLDENVHAGTRTLTFTPKAIASGIYYARLTVDEFSRTIKMVYLK